MATSNHTESTLTNKYGHLFELYARGDVGRVEKFLENLSADEILSIRDESYATLAHYASRYGHESFLRYLIEEKQLLLKKLLTNLGATCAHDAAVCDQVHILRYVLNVAPQRLHWSTKDTYGHTPLHLAAKYGSMKCLDYLLNTVSADPYDRTNDGLLPIHFAITNGSEESIRMLISAAPDIFSKERNEDLSSVHLACETGSMEIIQLLSSHGADFHLTNQSGCSCLHIACAYGHISVVQWLVETVRININIVDHMNRSSLHYAAKGGNELVLNYLLDRKARIILSDDGSSPLHIGAANGKEEACRILITRGGCSVVQMNRNNQTPIDVAENAGHQILANYLRRYKQSKIHSDSDSNHDIHLENATIVRLVVKKRNVERNDAANQVDENDLDDSMSSGRLTNHRFDLSELHARVEEHEASRNDSSNPYQISDVLMHSLASLNQLKGNRRHSKLPKQIYAPWLKQTNMSSEAFQQEIQRVGANLRKVRRDDLLSSDKVNNEADEYRPRQNNPLGSPIMSKSFNTDSNQNDVNHQNSIEWKRTGFESRLNKTPISRSHQFITSPETTNRLEVPQWKQALIDRRRGITNGQIS